MNESKSSGPPTRHQVKTEATLRGLLDAAETIFVRDGYERAQIETIATEAGRTKGAVYAHFESKEDIFFTLLERRIRTRQAALLQSIDGLPFDRQIDVVKQRFVNAVEDENWHILMLEFKLFTLRNKASLQRMQELYYLLYDSVAEAFLARGASLTGPEKDWVIAGLAILRGIPAAVILERQFCPVLNSPGTRQVLEELFDWLLNRRDRRPGRKSK